MKTKNNVQKAVLRSAAVIVSLVLISYTVSAQGFWERLLSNSSFGDIAIALTETGKMNVEAAGANTGNAQFVIETEPALQLESWMMDYSKFNTAAFHIEAASDTELTIEPWMMDESLFEPAEKALELEDWMVSDAMWNI
ncbi:hypothetical protein D1614_08730 [Maribellus luteus]|uniref:Uncharacterized protein n=1 Tax=Maribellus luteus TaxID=2305463 RepID=A0A399T1F0_9BACT|nr:hypothetical protein [Maribellus luteus]RIJ48612.1 hypothetical protein D1614_08730 [Maribellus luteus]